MSDETAFRAAIRANPTDTTARLVYADWLDENDRPHDAARERVLAEPADDLHRLAFADLCEREGDADWAELIRSLCRLEQERAKLPATVEETWSQDDQIRNDICECCSEIAARLLAPEHARDWFDVPTWRTVWNGLPVQPPCGVVTWVPMDRTDLGGIGIEATPVRGFIGEVNCRADQWEQYGDVICEHHPIARVRLVTEPSYPREGIRTSVFPPRAWSAEVAGRVVTLEKCDLDAFRTVAPTGRQVTVALWSKRWPGVAFDVSVTDGTWSTPINATPLEDLRRFQEVLKGLHAPKVS